MEKNKNSDRIEKELAHLTWERGATSWLNALPLKPNLFIIKKSASLDVAALAYGRFHVVFHVLPCTKANWGIHLHETNFFLNSYANLLSGVCHDVEIGTHLLQLQGDTFVIKSTTTVNDAR